MSEKQKGPGTGSITPLRNGRFWVRSPEEGNGKRRGLGTFATREEAQRKLDTYLFVHANAPAMLPHRMTFARYARTVFEDRGLAGIRGIDKEVSRFEVHLAKCRISDMPLVEVGPADISRLADDLYKKRAQDKRGDRLLSSRTVQRCISLVSIVYSAALRAGKVAVNPCTGVKIRQRHAEAVQEEWTFLTLDEQRKLAACEDIPYADRVMMRFCIWTGIRQGEFSHNLLTDLHVDVDDPFLYVRYGSKNKPPKSGKRRKVPLFGDGLAAAKEWLALLPSYCPDNPEGLIFPTPLGNRRGIGKPLGQGRKLRQGEKHPRATARGWLDRLSAYYALAGIPDRPGLHWHALRHTCGSSLVQGLWGRVWTLEEIREHLGHSSIVVTQKYAHLGETALKRAARETGVSYTGYGAVTEPDPVHATPNIPQQYQRSHLRDLNSRPTVYESTRKPLENPALSSEGPPVTDPLVTTLAAAMAALMKEGNEAEALALATLIRSNVAPTRRT